MNCIDNDMSWLIILWHIMKIGWPVVIIACVTLMGHGRKMSAICKFLLYQPSSVEWVEFKSVNFRKSDCLILPKNLAQKGSDLANQFIWPINLSGQSVVLTNQFIWPIICLDQSVYECPQSEVWMNLGHKGGIKDILGD